MPVTILSLNGLSKSYGTELVFRDGTAQIQERERIALVGVNGAGKSTLLRILAGLETPDGGSIVSKAGLRITYQAQEARFAPEQALREAAFEAFHDVRQISAELARLEQAMATAEDDGMETLLERYGELRTRFEAAGGYEIEHRTDQVLAGLGFHEEHHSIPVSYLSGGQKTRLALARALLTDPDLLLLDEPTNHLDINAIEWLEGFLKSWNRAVIVISHDRYFLDRVTERTLELSFGQLEDYPASYSRYLELREERLARRMAEYEAQQEFIARTEEFIRRYKAGQRTKEARGRETRLARLERIERPQQHEELRLRLASGLRSGRIVLSTSELQIGYPPAPNKRAGATLIRTPELTVERHERIALIGPNGIGKTTFLLTIMGEIPALAGRLQFGTNVKPAYYAQGHEGLDPEQSALSTILTAQPMSEEGARSLLGRFLFSGDDVYKPVSALSGGERSRLALAKLTLEHANFLILDEPTNHLDISSRETLEEVLDDFEGSILFVSHDRYLIDRIATQVWVIEDGQIRTYLGNYSDYLRARERISTPATAAPAGGGRAEPSSTRSRSTERMTDRERRKRQQELAAAERVISQLEARLNQLSDELARATQEQDVEQIAALGEQYEQTQAELDETYARWEELGTLLQADTEQVTS